MPLRLNMRQIEAFRALMLTGTVTQAGDLLGTSQPAVSRLIKQLEVEVGFPLFHRERGRLRPVPEAEALFHEVERAYISLDHISNFIGGIHRKAGGNLRLLTTLPMAHCALPEILRRFRAEAPGTTVSLRTMIRRDTREWLDAQQFDLAIANVPIDYPANATLPLVGGYGVCVMAPDHPLAEKKEIWAEDVGPFPFISMASETRSRFKVDRVFEAAKVRRNLAIEAQTSTIVCEFVLAGLGISVIEPFIVRGFEERGLVSRPFRPKIPYEFCVLFPLQRPPSREALRLLEIAKEYFRADARNVTA